MSEVQRYYVGKYGLVEGEALGRLGVVLGADFDRVTAERDAGLAREAALAQNLKCAEQGYLSIAESADASAQTLHEVIARLKAERDALQQRLTAADERAAGGGAKVISTGYDIDWKEPVGGHAIVLGDVFGLTFAGSVYGDLETKQRSLNFPGGYGVTIYGDIPEDVRFVLHGPEVEKPAEGGGDDRPNGCCCPPKGFTGLWAGASCPIHQGLRAIKP